jgi:hypothetical protein
LRLRADQGLTPGQQIRLGWKETAGICYTGNGQDSQRATWGEE